MFSLRRAAFRALSIKPLSVAPQTRSIVSITARDVFQTRKPLASFAFQRRFASDEVAKSTAGEASAAEPKDAAPSEPAVKADEGSVVEPVSESAAETASQDAPAASSPTSSGARSSSARQHIGASESTLYVGNLFFEVTEKDLQQRFAQYGPIAKTTIIYDPRGLSKGFGYVQFENKSDAQTAISQADQDVFQGRRMAVQQHRQRERATRRGPITENEPSRTLFIGNMSYEMSDKDLNDLFRQIKGVVDVRVAIDRNTGQPRGFAHADFTDAESATKAKDYLSTKEMYGRMLRVDFSKTATGDRRA